MEASLPFECELVQWLNEQTALGCPCYTLVPADRPDRFVTVERTGGSCGAVLDRPSLAIQCWAPTAVDAARLADTLSTVVLPSVYELPDVGYFSVDSLYAYPLDERQPRYQLTASAVVHKAYSKQASTNANKEA